MKRFYVYGLFVGNDLVPRYIGMGSGYRMNIHVQNAKRELARNISPSKNLGILHAIGCGLSVTPRKLYENLTKEDAYEIEKRLIYEIGRADLLKGPLWNRSDGGTGSLNVSLATRKILSRKSRATMASPEIRKRLKECKLGNKYAIGNKSNTGRHFSLEHREKIRIAALRRWAK